MRTDSPRCEREAGGARLNGPSRGSACLRFGPRLSPPLWRAAPLAAALAAALAASVHSARAEDVRDIEEQILSGRIESALASCDDKLRASPQDLEVQLWRGLIVERLDRAASEREACAKLAAEQPLLATHCFSYAVLPGDLFARVERLEQALAREPEHAPARLLLAELLIEQGRITAARRHLALLDGKQLGANARYLVILRARALGLGTADERRQAAALLAEWIRGEECAPQALFEAASLALEMGSIDEARRHLELARYRSPAAPRGFFLAARLAERGSVSAALAACERGLEHWPSEPRLLAFRIAMLLALDKLEDAALAFAASRDRLERSAPHLWHELACAIAWRRQSAPALEEALRAWTPRPEEGSGARLALLFEGRLAALRGDVEALRAALDEIPAGERAELEAIATRLEDKRARKSSREYFLKFLAGALLLALIALAAASVRRRK